MEIAPNTTIDEIAEDIYRISVFVSDIGPTGFTFNQFLINAEQPMIFHTGPRGMFPLVSNAIESVLPVSSLRWIGFGHVESDECGAMNNFLAAAPAAQVVHSAVGCLVSVNDLADRPPKPMEHYEVLDLGGKRMRHLDTPHVPHGWVARAMFEETTVTLFCGDLFTHTGRGPAVTESDLLEPANDAEDMFQSTCLTPHLASTIATLAEFRPLTLAVMHGSSYRGDGGTALRGLAALYDARFKADMETE
jgi:flavorubredoxin